MKKCAMSTTLTLAIFTIVRANLLGLNDCPRENTDPDCVRYHLTRFPATFLKRHSVITRMGEGSGLSNDFTVKLALAFNGKASNLLNTENREVYEIQYVDNGGFTLARNFPEKVMEGNMAYMLPMQRILKGNDNKIKAHVLIGKPGNQKGVMVPTIMLTELLNGCTFMYKISDSKLIVAHLNPANSNGDTENHGFTLEHKYKNNEDNVYSVIAPGNANLNEDELDYSGFQFYGPSDYKYWTQNMHATVMAFWRGAKWRIFVQTHGPKRNSSNQNDITGVFEL